MGLSKILFSGGKILFSGGKKFVRRYFYRLLRKIYKLINKKFFPNEVAYLSRQVFACNLF